ncbi:MAG: outer membrane protein [Methylocella sp.]|jgi:outer membrane immunogenic protein
MKREFIRYLAGAAAGVLLAGSPAIAADLTPVPPPAPVFTWTGFELGLHVGGGSDRTRVNLYDLYDFSDSYNSTGAFGGAHVGFNYQLMGPLVIGVQGEYNFAGLIGNSSAFPLNYLATSVREFGSADARIGYAFDHLLVYAIGGFAYGDIRGTINFQGFPGFPAPYVTGFPVNRFFDANRYGFDVGGGLEYNFYGNWTARLEYRYYDFGTRGFADAGFAAPVSIAIPNHSSQETMQTGRIGLTYKFAWPSTPVVAKY